MTIDASGNIYVTGTTTSTNTTGEFPASSLPESLPYQSASRASIQFFVTKVNTTAAISRVSLTRRTLVEATFDTTDTGCGRWRHCGRHQWKCLLHRKHELRVHGMLGMQHYGLSDPECVPAVSRSSAPGDGRQSANVLEYDYRRQNRMPLWRSSISIRTYHRDSN